ncbi:uncharacterized protein V1510DRAFT_401075 [Dipodascopsis tothii]|uniref:uncharacterized protein n=1 Tax=Dipodascopsis tothii TaxID=44089 RepID=UPI0034CE8AE0
MDSRPQRDSDAPMGGPRTEPVPALAILTRKLAFQCEEMRQAMQKAVKDQTDALGRIDSRLDSLDGGGPDRAGAADAVAAAAGSAVADALRANTDEIAQAVAAGTTDVTARLDQQESMLASMLAQMSASERRLALLEETVTAQAQAAARSLALLQSLVDASVPEPRLPVLPRPPRPQTPPASTKRARTVPTSPRTPSSPASAVLYATFDNRRRLDPDTPASSSPPRGWAGASQARRRLLSSSSAPEGGW